jgi:hypothetical protein
MNRRANVRAGGFRGRVVEHAVSWRGNQTSTRLLFVRPLLQGSSSYLLTLLGTHVTTDRIPLEHAAKWILLSTLCDEPRKPRVYRHRSGHQVLPDNLA